MCGAGGPCPSDSESSPGGDPPRAKKEHHRRGSISNDDQSTTPPPSSSSAGGSSTSDTTKPKRPHRKLSDGRKRSTSNLFHKCSKAFAETHPPPTTAQLHTASAAAKSHSDYPVEKASAPYDTASPPPKLTFTPKRSTLHPANVSGGLRRQLLNRRSQSPNPIGAHNNGASGDHQQAALLSPGYVQYQRSLLEVPMPRDYGDASSDDLSSEWDSDVPAEKMSPKVIIFKHM